MLTPRVSITARGVRVATVVRTGIGASNLDMTRHPNRKSARRTIGGSFPGWIAIPSGPRSGAEGGKGQYYPFPTSVVL